MIKNVAIVSLSSGIIGEQSVKFEVDIGLRRLKEYGLNVKFMPHALAGLEYVRSHPEKRAEDLLQAFRDPETDMILCAIGGDDTYRLLPYLFEHNELAAAVTEKIFLGFSDTTVNHLMLHKVGLRTFYGQSFLSDVCELGPGMHAYTKKYFEELIFTGKISEIRPSDVWYEERERFSPDQAGVPLHFHSLSNKLFQDKWAEDCALTVVAKDKNTTWFVVAGEDTLPGELPRPVENVSQKEKELRDKQKHFERVLQRIAGAKE
ncbi:MAG: LD-carboxypeptidase, partial [Clostridia bacterium]|nr:LD-carboxypeptidase [Clostridia bacterium]